METARIYHLSEGRSFPLEPGARGAFQLEAAHLQLADLPGLSISPSELSLLLIELSGAAALECLETLKKRRDLDDLPKLLLTGSEAYRDVQSRAALAPRTYLLDDSIRPDHLRILLDLMLQLEHYRRSVNRLVHDSRAQGRAFETVMDLARAEMQSAREESGALRALVEYEATQRRFEDSLQQALDRANSLRERELVALKRQLEAAERLSEYRDRELKEVRAVANAQEAVLEFSRQEGIERERILTALDRLRSLTDRELMDLFEENQQLRRRLGLPTRAE